MEPYDYSIAQQMPTTPLPMSRTISSSHSPMRTKRSAEEFRAAVFQSRTRSVVLVLVLVLVLVSTQQLEWCLGEGMRKHMKEALVHAVRRDGL